MSFPFRLCPTRKDHTATFPFTTSEFKFDLTAQNFLAATGRLCLIDARPNDATIGVHFDLCSKDPSSMMVKPGKVQEYGDIFFYLIQVIALFLSLGKRS
jgi:hypothetical protein